MNGALIKLGEISQDYYSKHKHLKEVVTPSIPIMYFGNYEAYAKSKLKIITVGLNPSNIEFQKNTKSEISFYRFPKWEKEQNFLASLNDYFETGKAYDKWFRMGFEKVLNGLDASYYSKENRDNIALHTDIFTPLATNPTWTKISKETKEELLLEGHEIWKKLVDILKPDIIITALSANDQKQIELLNKMDFIKVDKTKTGKTRKYPFFIQKATYNDIYTIVGRTNNIPFGNISHEMKVEIGERILKDFKK